MRKRSAKEKKSGNLVRRMHRAKVPLDGEQMWRNIYWPFSFHMPCRFFIYLIFKRNFAGKAQFSVSNSPSYSLHFHSLPLTSFPGLVILWSPPPPPLDSAYQTTTQSRLFFFLFFHFSKRSHQLTLHILNVF